MRFINKKAIVTGANRSIGKQKATGWAGIRINLTEKNRLQYIDN